MRRFLIAASLVLALLLAAGTGGAALFVRASLPVLEGTAHLPGLSAEATVARDSLGVPLISAASRADAARALGFVHAQERFFQMDLLRRAAAGELAALLGADLVPVDRRHRPHGFRPTARAAVESLPPAHRAVLSAYAEGVNAGLGALGARPWEYAVLRQAPAPWREEDSFLVAAAMFIDLQLEAMPEEAQYAALDATLPPALVALLLPRGDEWDAPLDGGEAPPLRVPAPDELGGFRPEPAPPDLRAVDSPAAGSNAWAVAGSRTAEGAAALLAGDMHLGLRLPHIWFRAALAFPGADGTPRRVAGVTLPGTPLVIVGSTGRVAWSFTNSYGDYIDLVRLEMARPGVVRTAAGEAPLDTLRETIAVAGGEPVPLEVVRSPFGPVLLTGHDGAPLAVQWTAHRPEAFNLALLELEEAASAEEALALGARVGIPAQNFTLADARGHVGWTTAGRVPRRVGRDGQRPVPSTDPDARWGGWLGPDEVPRLLNPPDGLVWTANNRAVSGEALARIGLGPYA
ncbi:MAG: penicillin acylase family protein, partial [Rubricoccaceae bacterium]